MASTSSAASIFNISVSEKLTRDNYLVWRAQVLPAIRGSRLMGILTGTVAQPSEVIRVEKPDKTVEETENPAYVAWIAQDQQLVAYLLSSMTKEILVQVSSCDHAAQLWTAITEMFSSQSRSRILQLRSQLSREKKGDLSASAYYSKMKGIADEMAAVGKKIDDDDLISYILNGLDSDYNPFVSSVSVKDSLSSGDLYAQLFSYEARLQQQRSDEGRFYSSANNATRGRGRGNFRGRGRGPSSGRGSGSNAPSFPRNQGTSATQDSDDAPLCQLCERYGHTVHDCWFCFNKKYVAPRDGGARPIKTAPQKYASSAAPFIWN